MLSEYTGNIYRFPLDLNQGYAFGQILDYSDVSAFDGILIRVFNKIQDDLSEVSISDIIATGIMFGPVPINKYPNVKGKNAWKLLGKGLNIEK